MDSDESNPRPTCDQSAYGIRDLTVTQLANPGSNRRRTICVPGDAQDA